jgi:hypothetical protein
MKNQSINPWINYSALLNSKLISLSSNLYKKMSRLHRFADIIVHKIRLKSRVEWKV